jgi:hypothetical protein
MGTSRLAISCRTRHGVRHFNDLLPIQRSILADRAGCEQPGSLRTAAFVYPRAGRSGLKTAFATPWSPSFKKEGLREFGEVGWWMPVPPVVNWRRLP